MSELSSLLKNNDFHFSKKFGQNFLSDRNLLRALVQDADVDSEDEVLEIGPGAGALTSALCEKAKRVVSYEIDKTLEPILASALSQFTNSEIIFKDALKEPIDEIEKHFSKRFKFVSNLPYYITTPIVFKFLEQTDRCQSVSIMVQKEVAEKMVALPGSKNYGVLTVMVNYYADVKVKRIVSKKMFTPVPKVDSAFVTMTVKPSNKDKDFQLRFRKLVMCAFSMRRKTLVNNLVMGLGITRIGAERELRRIGVSPNARAENLSVDNFIELAKNIM